MPTDAALVLPLENRVRGQLGAVIADNQTGLPSGVMLKPAGPKPPVSMIASTAPERSVHSRIERLGHVEDRHRAGMAMLERLGASGFDWPE